MILRSRFTRTNCKELSCTKINVLLYVLLEISARKRGADKRICVSLQGCVYNFGPEKYRAYVCIIMAEEKHHLRGIPYLFSATPFEKAGRGRFHGEQNGLTRFEFTVIRETL